eukprot:COSAG06_NODE_25455_length_636_cov_1.139665_1_plen_207_part_10
MRHKSEDRSRQFRTRGYLHIVLETTYFFLLVPRLHHAEDEAELYESYNDPRQTLLIQRFINYVKEWRNRPANSNFPIDEADIFYLDEDMVEREGSQLLDLKTSRRVFPLEEIHKYYGESEFGFLRPDQCFYKFESTYEGDPDSDFEDEQSTEDSDIPLSDEDEPEPEPIVYSQSGYSLSDIIDTHPDFISDWLDANIGTADTGPLID